MVVAISCIAIILVTITMAVVAIIWDAIFNRF